MTISVNGEKYKVLKKFKVLHEGWEMDNEYYVVEKNNKPTLVTSSHGKLYFSKDKKMIEKKIKEYKEILKETQEALKILYGQS